MSHIAKFAGASFKDIKLLTQAFRGLGWQVAKDATIRTYSSREQKIVFPFAAQNPTEGYDVGLTKNAAGVWELNGDFSMSNIHDQLSGEHKMFEKLQQQYNLAHQADYILSHNGTMEHTTLADGTILLEAEVEVEV